MKSVYSVEYHYKGYFGQLPLIKKEWQYKVSLHVGQNTMDVLKWNWSIIF